MNKPVCIFLIFIIMSLTGILSAGATHDTPDIKKIVNQVDRLYRSMSSETEVEMIIVTPNWKRKLKMKMWTKGLARTFIYIISPEKDSGIATLRIDSSMWNYFPKIDKVIKVPPSMMMASWMGSDFTNDDLVKETSLLEDYHASFTSIENEDPDCFYIKLVPKKETTTVWGKILLVIRKKDIMPVKQIFFDEKDTKVRVMTFKNIKIFGDRKIPATLEIISEKNKGKKTILTYINARFDTEIDKSVFTRRNLQKKR